MEPITRRSYLITRAALIWLGRNIKRTSDVSNVDADDVVDDATYRMLFGYEDGEAIAFLRAQNDGSDEGTVRKYMSYLRSASRGVSVIEWWRQNLRVDGEWSVFENGDVTY